MAEELENVIADLRSDADALERTGNLQQATYLRTIAKRAEASAEGWLTWLSEPDATLRAGYGIEWMRGRFETMRRENNARFAGKNRQYRMCAVPRKANTVSAATKGREAARRLKKA